MLGTLSNENRQKKIFFGQVNVEVELETMSTVVNLARVIARNDTSWKL